MSFDLASFGSSLLSNVTDFAEQRYFNRTQNAFTKGMADTQYQRGAADLKAAGINPILAYASPDAAPSGAAGTASWSDPVSSAYQNANAKETNELIQAQKQLALNQSSAASADAAVKTAAAETAALDLKYYTDNYEAINKAKLQAAIAGATASSAGAQSALMDIKARQELGQGFANLQKALEGVSGAAPLLKLLESILQGGKK